MTTPIRQLRSDAVANRERLLTAAAAVVKRDGEKVPMAEIAQAAGVGVGTLYRHYPTREDLLSAVEHRSWDLVLANARAAAGSRRRGISALALFLERTIKSRRELILPLHAAPVRPNRLTAAKRREISNLIEQVLTRGREDGTIRPDVTSADVIIMGAQLAQPLPHVADWDQLARRQARIYLDGLANTGAAALPVRVPARLELSRNPPRR